MTGIGYNDPDDFDFIDWATPVRQFTDEQLAEHDAEVEARVRADGVVQGMQILAGQFQQRGLSEAARIAFDTAEAVKRDGGAR